MDSFNSPYQIYNTNGSIVMEMIYDPLGMEY